MSGLAVTDPQGCTSKEKWSEALQLDGCFSLVEVSMGRGQ